MSRTSWVLAAAVGMAALLAVPGVGTAGVRCSPSLAGELASTRDAAQVVTVSSAGRTSTSGTLELWQRRGGCWRRSAGPWSVYLGYAGISDHHREGDGSTPAGAFGIGPVMYGVAPDPGVRFGYHRLVCGDWWDEDSSSPAYNTFQHVPCGTRPPFGGASEALWESTRAYAHFAFVEYNSAPAVPGVGSAIFIHEDLGGPTNGCITLPPPELLSLFLRLRPRLRPLVVIGTAAEIRRF